MARIESEIVIASPVEIVWALTQDLERWPAITPTMTEVERLDDGPLRVGSTARVKQPGRRAAVWTVTSFEAPTEFVWESSVFGMKMVAGHHLSAEGDGCRNHLTVDLSGTGSGLLAKLLGGRILDAIRRENEGFRKAAEARHRDAGVG